nr:hypothetical protein [Tanacetum cinerariifolium]
MAVRTQQALSPGMSARIAKATALSLSFFRKSERDELGEGDTKEDKEDESSDDKGHGLGVYYHGLDDGSQGLEDEGLGLEEVEVVSEGQQQAVLVVETAASEPSGLGYGALRRRDLAVEDDHVPSTFEVSQSSSFTIIPVVSSPIALPVATPTATISVDEDQFIKATMQRELQEMRCRVTALEQEMDHREE